MRRDARSLVKQIDLTPAPDLWHDIELRQPGPPTPEPSNSSRLAAALVASVIAVAGLTFLVLAFERGDRDAGTVDSTPSATVRNGVIAYVKLDDPGVIYTVHPDGNGPGEIRPGVRGNLVLPNWSQDGRWFAFAVESHGDPAPKGGNWDIYVANADGSGAVRLTSDGVSHHPTWLPDSERIGYLRGWGRQQIWVVGIDGSPPVRLTEGSGLYLGPSWSPDGSRIAYSSVEGGVADIYMMGADGSDPQNVTDDAAWDAEPEWSPDGETVAFVSDRGGEPGLYLMDPDGGGLRRVLVEVDVANLQFAWSPDGTAIAVSMITGPGFARTLSILDVATGKLAPVVGPGPFCCPAWQQAPGAEASSTLRVSCEGSRTTVLTPVVQSHADGVHVVVEGDTAGVTAVLLANLSYAPVRNHVWSSGSEGVDDEFTRPVPPGRGRVFCAGEGEELVSSPVSIRLWPSFDIVPQ